MERDSNNTESRKDPPGPPETLAILQLIAAARAQGKKASPEERVRKMREGHREELRERFLANLAPNQGSGHQAGK